MVGCALARRQGEDEMAGFYLIAIIIWTCIALVFVFPIYFYIVDRRRRAKDKE